MNSSWRLIWRRQKGRPWKGRWCWACSAPWQGAPLDIFLTVEIANNSSHISQCLRVGRHAVILFHALRSGVVSRQSFAKVMVIADQQFTQVACSTFHVGGWVHGILYPHSGGSLRHQLHESLRTLRGNCLGIESTFGQDHGVEDRKS